MTPQELKSSILQRAIQGKLVEQRPEEGTGEELFKQIQAEKARLIKEGKLKKEKPLPAITEDEIPFDIPESWKWVKLGQVSTVNGGYAFKSSDYSLEGTRVVRISDFSEAGFINTKIVRHKYEDYLAQFLINERDILLCMTGGTVGKSLIVSEIHEPMLVNQRVAKISSVCAIPEYLYLIITCPITQSAIQHKKNSTNDNISMEDIVGFLVPLPPLAEQKRIIAKIEELLPLVEQYEKAYNRLEQLNKQFPDDMKKSILQLAIQGKLVEQKPEEGTGEELYKQIQAEKVRLIKEGKLKKEKPLPPISEDEIPFDIPDSWIWMRLGFCSTYSQPKEKISSNEITPELWSLDLEDIEKETGRIISFVQAKERKITGDKVVFHKDQILYSKLRPYLKKILVAPADGICTPELVPFSVFGGLNLQYVVNVLKSPHVDYVINSVTYGVKMPRVGTETMESLLMPLPPLAEQKRIVAKIEELLPLCDLLK